MIKNFVKISELLGDRLEVCVSVYLKKKFRVCFPENLSWHEILATTTGYVCNVCSLNGIVSIRILWNLIAPTMTTARALSVTVTLVHVRPYVRLSVHQYVTPLSNSFDQNFCALSLIILFYICACCDTRFKNVCLFLFVEVKALLGLCHMLYNIRHKIKFLCLWNLVTLLHP